MNITPCMYIDGLDMITQKNEIADQSDAQSRSRFHFPFFLLRRMQHNPFATLPLINESVAMNSLLPKFDLATLTLNSSSCAAIRRS